MKSFHLEKHIKNLRKKYTKHIQKMKYSINEWIDKCVTNKEYGIPLHIIWMGDDLVESYVIDDICDYYRDTWGCSLDIQHHLYWDESVSYDEYIVRIKR